MEKINSITILTALLISTIELSAQSTSVENNQSSLGIVFSELNIEVGVDRSCIKNDTLAQVFAASPFLTFHYDNYLSEKLKLDFMLTPIAVHTSKSKQSFVKERYFQPEFGVSVGYRFYRNLWFAVGGGYAFRMYKQYRIGANNWVKSPYRQPGFFMYGSVDYWFKTAMGVRVSAMVNREGYCVKAGLFVSVNSITNFIKKLSFKAK